VSGPAAERSVPKPRSRSAFLDLDGKLRAVAGRKQADSFGSMKFASELIGVRGDPHARRARHAT
jgi:hypothetical protein